MAAKLTCEPTDKSISAQTITNVIPTAIIVTTAVILPTALAVPKVAKFGAKRIKKPITIKKRMYVKCGPGFDSTLIILFAEDFKSVCERIFS
tara:strand:+ start:1876 stop:2151 length:276 start_codon:yes stop_codon:yes gene_type:complete